METDTKYAVLMVGDDPSDSYEWGEFNTINEAVACISDKQPQYPNLNFEIIIRVGMR